MKISTFDQLEKFLESRIPPKEAVFTDDIGFRRAKYFMRLLGNPQNKIKVVHVAGTSGKGSTVHLVSKLLESQGFRVGLSISPHMFDIRERMQVFRSPSWAGSRTRTTNAGHANTLVKKEIILKYFNQILPIILEMKKCEFGMPTFFEINIGLAYYMFSKEKLDYVVMETGLGGRLDATNTVSSKNKVAIITRIGYDHMEFLGNTVSKIAQEKLEIIKNKNIVISHQQSVVINNTIKKKCSDEKAALYLIGKNNYKIISLSANRTVFDFCLSHVIPGLIRNLGLYFCPDSRFRGNDKEEIFCYKKINLGLLGKHQAENCSLALACLVLLAKRDRFLIDEKRLRKTLGKISIPGRFEIKKIQKNTVIIDGAHNEQKMDVFVKNLSLIYPKQKFTFLLAFKKGKDYQAMLKKIIPKASKIFLTNFSTKNTDNYWGSIDTKKLAEFLKTQHFHKFEIISNKKSEIQKAIFASKKPAVITGSLYFIGSIYKYLK